MWTLILTPIMVNASGGVTIRDVRGFASEAECRAAGTVWLNSVNERARVVALVSCVPTSGSAK